MNQPRKYQTDGTVKYPIAEYVSRNTEIPLSDLYKYSYWVANHETGGSFDPAQKAMTGGPDAGLYQIIPDALPTLAKRARSVYREMGIPSPGYLDQILNKKITSAAQLDTTQQTDLFFAGLTYLDQSGNPKIWDSVKAMNNPQTAAQVWMDTHNRATDPVKREKRKRKFINDNVGLEPEDIYRSGGVVNHSRYPYSPYTPLAQGDVNPIMPHQFQWGGLSPSRLELINKDISEWKYNNLPATETSRTPPYYNAGNPIIDNVSAFLRGDLQQERKKQIEQADAIYDIINNDISLGAPEELNMDQYMHEKLAVNDLFATYTGAEPKYGTIKPSSIQPPEEKGATYKLSPEVESYIAKDVRDRYNTDLKIAGSYERAFRGQPKKGDFIGFGQRNYSLGEYMAWYNPYTDEVRYYDKYDLDAIPLADQFLGNPFHVYGRIQGREPVVSDTEMNSIGQRAEGFALGGTAGDPIKAFLKLMARSQGTLSPQDHAKILGSGKLLEDPTKALSPEQTRKGVLQGLEYSAGVAENPAIRQRYIDMGMTPPDPDYIRNTPVRSDPKLDPLAKADIDELIPNKRAIVHRSNLTVPGPVGAHEGDHIAKIGNLKFMEMQARGTDYAKKTMAAMKRGPEYMSFPDQRKISYAARPAEISGRLQELRFRRSPDPKDADKPWTPSMIQNMAMNLDDPHLTNTFYTLREGIPGSNAMLNYPLDPEYIARITHLLNRMPSVIAPVAIGGAMMGSLGSQAESFQEGGTVDPSIRAQAELLWKRNQALPFIQRWNDPNQPSIPNPTGGPGTSTHLMAHDFDSNGDWWVYPRIQEIDGELKYPISLKEAKQRGNAFKAPRKIAEDISLNYKNFQNGGAVDKYQLKGLVKTLYRGTYGAPPRLSGVKFYADNAEYAKKFGSDLLTKNLREDNYKILDLNKYDNELRKLGWDQSGHESARLDLHAVNLDDQWEPHWASVFYQLGDNPKARELFDKFVEELNDANLIKGFDRDTQEMSYAIIDKSEFKPRFPLEYSSFFDRVSKYGPGMFNLESNALANDINRQLHKTLPDKYQLKGLVKAGKKAYQAAKNKLKIDPYNKLRKETERLDEIAGNISDQGKSKNLEFYYEGAYPTAADIPYINSDLDLAGKTAILQNIKDDLTSLLGQAGWEGNNNPLTWMKDTYGSIDKAPKEIQQAYSQLLLEAAGKTPLYPDRAMDIQRVLDQPAYVNMLFPWDAEKDWSIYKKLHEKNLSEFPEELNELNIQDVNTEKYKKDIFRQSMDQKPYQNQYGGVPKAQYGDHFDGGVPKYGDYARDAGDYYMRYIDSPKFAQRADNFGYNYRQYGPGSSGEPIEGVTGKSYTPTIEDVRAQYKNTHTNPRINPLTVNVTNDPNQPTTAGYTEGFGANHIGGNYNPNDSNLSAQDLMAHEMAHSFQYGEQDYIISQGNDPNALSGEKLERQYVIDRLADEGFEKIPKDWRSEVLKSTINPNLRNSSMAETATSYSGFMPAAPGAHDIDFREVKADIWALRKKAYDMGIYDDINDPKFEKEHLQKMQEADPENLMINRIIENFGEESLIDFMNELVDTGNGSQAATTAQYGGTMNTMGYRDDSPYKHLPAIPIEGNNITMDNVSMPLLLIPNAGQAQVAPPNSGHYQFPGASRVLEIPLMKEGGEVEGDPIKAIKRLIKLGSKSKADELVEPITSHSEMMKSYKPKSKTAQKLDDIAHRFNLHREYMDYVDSNNENLKNYLKSLNISTRNKFPLQTQVENTIDYGNHRVKTFGKNIYEPDFDTNARYVNQMNDLDDTYTDIYNRIAEAEKWDIQGAVANVNKRSRYMRNWINEHYPAISNEDWIKKYGSESSEYPLEMTYIGQNVDRIHNRYNGPDMFNKDYIYSTKDLDAIHENFDKYNSTLRAMMPQDIYQKMMSDVYKEVGPVMPFQHGGKAQYGKTASHDDAKQNWNRINTKVKEVGADAFKQQHPEAWNWYWENAPSLSSKQFYGGVESDAPKIVGHVGEGVMSLMGVPQALGTELVHSWDTGEPVSGKKVFGSLHPEGSWMEQSIPSDYYTTGNVAGDMIVDMIADPLMFNAAGRFANIATDLGIGGIFAPIAYEGYRRTLDNPEDMPSFVDLMSQPVDTAQTGQKLIPGFNDPIERDPEKIMQMERDAWEDAMDAYLKTIGSE